MIRAALLKYLQGEGVEADRVTDWEHDIRYDPSPCGCCSGMGYYALVISYTTPDKPRPWSEYEIRGELDDIFKSIEV